MTDSKPAKIPGSSVGGDRSLEYWGNTTADVSGMLGGIPDISGFSSINRVDLQGSRTFLARFGIGLKDGRRRVKSVLEGGAGIGRVTEGLLLPIAEEVDVVEPVAKLTAALQGKPGVRSISNVGLAEWRPSEGVSYNIVWIQWCLGYLTDTQLVDHLRLCGSVLADDGLIVVKENLSTGGHDHFHEEDGSITREDTKFRDLFKEAGLRLVRTDLQRGVPQQDSKRLFPIKMYALKPDLSQ